VSPKRSRPMRGIDGLGLVRWWVGWGKPGCGKNCGKCDLRGGVLSPLLSCSDRPPFLKRASRLQYSRALFAIFKSTLGTSIFMPRELGEHPLGFPSACNCGLLVQYSTRTVPVIPVFIRGKKKRVINFAPYPVLSIPTLRRRIFCFFNTGIPQQRYQYSRSSTCSV